MLKMTTREGHEFFTFQSVVEINEYVDKAKIEKYLESSSGNAGRSFRNFLELETATKEAWNEGLLTMNDFIEKLEKAELPKIKDLKVKKVFNSSEGEIDFDRLMAGNPDHYLKTVSEKGEGNPEVTICIDTAAPWSVSATDVLWRGAAAIALVKVLEAQGYRTEVWTLSGSSIYENHPDRGVVAAACLKRPGDPLDISTLINTVSAWFFRYETFAMFATIAMKENQDLSPSLGQHYTPTQSDLDLLTTDQKRVYSAGVFSFNGALSLMLNELTKIANEE